MKIKNNQKGFSLVEGLLLVIALSLIVFVGYYVWHSQKQADTNLTAAANTSDSSAKTSAAQSTSQKSANDNLFKFKELGVGIVLSSELKGLSYSADASNNTQYDVTTPGFTQEGSSCKDFAEVYKGTGTFSEKSATLLKQFNGFYIAAAMPACIDSDTAPQLQSALTDAFKTAQEL